MTSIEVTFLGTTATIPTKTRNHPAIHLRYVGEQEAAVLFDCGEGTQRQIFRAGLNFMRINKIFITHWHADHFAGLLGLLTTMNLEGRKRPLEIYAPEAEKFVFNLLSIGYWNRSFDVIPKNVEFEGNKIELLVDDEEYEITSIPVNHRIPAVGFCLQEKDRIKIDKQKTKKLGLPLKGMIYKKLKEKGTVEYKGKTIKLENVSFIEQGKKVAYSGDTLPCRNMIKLAKNADLLIHDSTYFNADTRTSRHANVEQVLEIAKQSGAKKTILTHISRRYTDMQDLNDKIKDHKNVTLAKDLMKVVV